MEEFFTDSVTLQPYWELAQTLWKEGSRERELIENIQGLAPRDKATFRLKNPLVRAPESRLEAARSRFRRRNPELDWLVVKWYEGTPRTRLAEEKLREWQAGVAF